MYEPKPPQLHSGLCNLDRDKIPPNARLIQRRNSTLGFRIGRKPNKGVVLLD
jgi:hypothetical protein